MVLGVVIALLVIGNFLVFTSGHDVVRRRMALHPREGARERGPTRLRVTVVADERDPAALIGLGESIEPVVLANPVLTSGTFHVRTAVGDVLRVTPGAALHVVALSGARRRVLEKMTTSRGIEQLLSFEIAPNTAFTIQGYLPEALGPGGSIGSAYREGEIERELLPLAGGYAVSDRGFLMPKNPYRRPAVATTVIYWMSTLGFLVLVDLWLVVAGWLAATLTFPAIAVHRQKRLLEREAAGTSAPPGVRVSSAALLPRMRTRIAAPESEPVDEGDALVNDGAAASNERMRG